MAENVPRRSEIMDIELTIRRRIRRWVQKLVSRWI
jgi:hypothetical protein